MKLRLLVQEGGGIILLDQQEWEGGVSPLINPEKRRGRGRELSQVFDQPTRWRRSGGHYRPEGRKKGGPEPQACRLRSGGARFTSALRKGKEPEGTNIRTDRGLAVDHGRGGGKPYRK